MNSLFVRVTTVDILIGVCIAVIVGFGCATRANVIAIIK